MVIYPSRAAWKSKAGGKCPNNCIALLSPCERSEYIWNDVLTKWSSSSTALQASLERV